MAFPLQAWSTANRRQRRRFVISAAAESHNNDAEDELTPSTPAELHRRAAAAYQRSLDEVTNPEPSSMSNSVSPMARGVCWSNLQDLDTVPDDAPVYILVFGAGTGSEGLYSLQERTKEDVPVDIILAFPSHEDAARYGTLLEAEMGRIPVVEAARPRDLRFTCREGGYRCKVARRGVLLLPPEKTVEVTDWERTNALRQGQWSVRLEDADHSGINGNCNTLMAAGVSAADQGNDGDLNCTLEDDELCELPENYNELSAREMLSRLYCREDRDECSEEE